MSRDSRIVRRTRLYDEFPFQVNFGEDFAYSSLPMVLNTIMAHPKRINVYDSKCSLSSNVCHNER